MTRDRADAARTALGEATGAFLETTGVAEQLRLQMLDHALDAPGSGSFTGKTFEELTRREMTRTKGGQAFLRRLSERGILTMFTLLGKEFSAITVGDLRRLPIGRDGLFSFLPKAGVNPDSGSTHALQEETVNRLGYTAGAEGAKRLNKALLTRAVTYYNRRAAAYGIPPTKQSAIREWAQRSHAKVFRVAQLKGIADHAKGQINTIKGL